MLPSLRDPDIDDEADTVDDTDRFVGFTAVEAACHQGDVGVLERLRPDPSRDDFDKLYRTASNCSPEILHALGRTPTMHARMKKVGFIPLPKDDPRYWEQSRPTRSREVLAKFGVEIPKEIPMVTPRLPRRVQIGSWRPDRRQLRLDRAALFDRVWSEPVENLAKATKVF